MVHLHAPAHQIRLNDHVDVCPEKIKFECVESMHFFPEVDWKGSNPQCFSSANPNVAQQCNMFAHHVSEWFPITNMCTNIGEDVTAVLQDQSDKLCTYSKQTCPPHQGLCVSYPTQSIFISPKPGVTIADVKSVVPGAAASCENLSSCFPSHPLSKLECKKTKDMVQAAEEVWGPLADWACQVAQ